MKQYPAKGDVSTLSELGFCNTTGEIISDIINTENNICSDRELDILN